MLIDVFRFQSCYTTLDPNKVKILQILQSIKYNVSQKDPLKLGIEGVDGSRSWNLLRMSNPH